LLDKSKFPIYLHDKLNGNASIGGIGGWCNQGVSGNIDYMPAKPDKPTTEKDEQGRSVKDKPIESQPKPGEIGGRDGPDPTRYGDWEKAGRCIDF
jgi:hypothetical protein